MININEVSFIDWYATIKKEVIDISAFLEIENEANAEMLDGTLEVARVWLARTVEMLATAEGYYLKARGEVLKQLTFDKEMVKLGAMLLKTMAENECVSQKMVFTQIGRLNACLTHSIDVWRSRLSYHKAEKHYTTNPGG
jgi:hypothetical protein